jgi:hypothetical protein
MEYTKQVLTNALEVLKYNEGLLKESIERSKEETELHETSLVDNLKRQVELKDALKKFE